MTHEVAQRFTDLGFTLFLLTDQNKFFLTKQNAAIRVQSKQAQTIIKKKVVSLKSPSGEPGTVTFIPQNVLTTDIGNRITVTAPKNLKALDNV